MTRCICGHLDTAHEHEGAGACREPGCPCTVRQDAPDEITAAALYGAERIIRRYMDARIAAAAAGGGEITSSDTQAFHRVAGLSEEWEQAAVSIASQKASGQIAIMTGGALPEMQAAAVFAIPAALLAEVIAASYLHGMTIGTLAALGITDPDPEGGDR